MRFVAALCLVVLIGCGSERVAVPLPNMVDNVVPTHLSIPDLRIESDLGEKYSWFRHSPVPGETGPTVLLGSFKNIKIGFPVYVLRSDGRVAEFQIQRIERYLGFPQSLLYGTADSPEIRLITEAEDAYLVAHGFLVAN